MSSPPRRNRDLKKETNSPIEKTDEILKQSKISASELSPDHSPNPVMANLKLMLLTGFKANIEV